jgi:hypothetical protein
MKKPSIHLNGTSAGSLLNAYMKAYNALRAAEHALLDTEPHARDYSPQQETAYAEARKEYMHRIASITQAKYDINELIVHVQDQVDNPSR